MPIRKIVHISWHSLLWVIGIILTVGVCLVAALFWRLAQGPVDMASLLPSVEAALVRDNSDLRFEVGEASLSWQSLDRPMLLKAKRVSVRSGTVPFFFAPAVDLDISLRRLLIGQISVQAVDMEGVSLSLTRAKDGAINISGSHSDDDVYGPQQIGVSRDVSLSGIMQSLPSIGKLHIANARIIYNDLLARELHVFHGGDLIIRQAGKSTAPDISGTVRLPFDDQKGKTITSGFIYDAEQKIAQVTTNLDGINPAGLKKALIVTDDALPIIDMNLYGQVIFALRDNFALHSLSLDINGQDGQVTWANGWGADNPLPLDQLKAKASVNLKNGTINMQDLNATLLNKTTITATGEAQLNDADALQSIAMDWDIRDLDQQAIAQFWPQNSDDTLIEKWMTERFSKGTYTQIDGSVALRRESDGTLPYPQELNAHMAFSDMDIDYANPLIPASKVKGKGVMTGKALTIDIESGAIDAIAVTKGSLVFDDLITTGSGTADINLTMAGPVPSVFDYLSREPIAATDTLDFDYKQSKGTADMDVRIQFPTVKDLLVEDVKVTATATLKALTLPNVLRGMALKGGPFTLKATTEEYSLEGTGTLDETPITLTWEERFSNTADQPYTARIQAQLITNNALRQTFNADPFQWIDGPAAIHVTYSEDASGIDTLVLDANLKESRLRIPELALDKPIAEDATLSLKGTITDSALTGLNQITLTSPMITIKNGSVTLDTNGTLRRASFDHIKTETNALQLTAKRAGGNTSPLQITVKGDAIDARPFLSSRDDGDNNDAEATDITDYHIQLQAARMRTHKTQSITNVTAYLETNNAGHTTRLEMDSTAGLGVLKLRYDPNQDGPYSLRGEATDAGATLKAFGLYPHMIKGRMDIRGKPQSFGRIEDVQGRATITDFSVSEAPVLAKLVNALSIAGLFDMLGNSNNLSFDRLETDFVWNNDPKGGIYTFTNGAVSSPSTGLTFAGVIDQQTRQMDIKGTAVPISGVNKFIGQIPILGDILTGGEGGGLIAATYTLSGPSNDPQASVNPLSVLAPGIIRRILFENNTPATATTADQAEENTRSPLN